MLLSNILWGSNIMTPVPSVIIGNISYDSFQCVSATSCTTDVDHHDRDSCQPQSLKDYKTVAIINIVLIIIIGGLGNLLTIVSICLCRLRHKKKYNHLWNSTTVLMLNLSIGDFLYCILGLPVFISVYSHGFLPHSESFCWYSAMLRNWIAYADFLTMAAIAVTRSLGCLLFRCNMENVASIIFQPFITIFLCIFIWILAFSILSPITFSMTIGSYYFGTFGYDARHGKCEVIQCQPQDGFFPGGFLFSVVFFVPFFLVLISYIFISTMLEIEKRRKRRTLNNQSQVPFGQIQVTLLVLSASYVLFALPVVIIENINISDADFVSLCVYSWYWWMYAINFLLYVTTLSDFRRLYKQLLSDFNIIKLNEEESDVTVNLSTRQQSSISSNNQVKAK